VLEGLKNAGKVKTVNGLNPDENGNIELDDWDVNTLKQRVSILEDVAN